MTDLSVNLHIAHTGIQTGYGKFEAGLWRGLEQAGVTVYPMGWYSAGLEEIIKRSRNGSAVPEKFSRLAPITVVFARPHEKEFWHVRNTRAWLYTMTETDRVDPFWVELINQYYERVLVPCPQLVEVYKNSGVKCPVDYLVPGVDFTVPEPKDRRREGQRVFMTYSLGDTRKGAQLALMAFKMAFGDRPNYQLWIKCTEPGQSWVAGARDPQVRVLTGAMSEMEWFMWLSYANYFIFPSYGEGFGLPPREATLMGVPTAATPWLGMWDVEHWGYPTTISRLRSHSFIPGTVNADGALWAETDLMALKDQLIWLDEHEPEAREKTQQGRDYLLNNFTWKHSASALIKLLQEHGS
jgi:glycosyltransferase involved in cell wall biosynthesis